MKVKLKNKNGQLLEPTITSSSVIMRSGDTLDVEFSKMNNNKQSILVSGSNIKTINNQSVLGSGNIDIKNTVPIGTIIMWSGDKGNAKTWTDTDTTHQTHTYYEPVEGWLLCDGASYFRSNNSGDYLEGTLELYNIIGSNYGTSYGRYKLPDLSGRFPLGVGNSSTTGATSHSLAEKGGQETVTLTADQSGLPAHNHSANSSALYSNDTTGTVAPSLVPRKNEGNYGTVYTTINNNTAQNAQESHTNMPPYLTINFIIKYK